MRKRWIVVIIFLIIAIVCIGVYAATEYGKAIRSTGRVVYEICRLIRIATTPPS